MRDECLSCRRIPCENRSEAGRIHKAHAACEQRARHKNLSAANSLQIFGIALFGDILSEIGDVDVLPRTILSLYARKAPLSKSDHRRDRSDRSESDREDGIANQRINKRRFAALELPHAGDIEAAFRDPAGEIVRLFFNAAGSQFIRQVSDPEQARNAVADFSIAAARACIFKGSIRGNRRIAFIRSHFCYGCERMPP